MLEKILNKVFKVTKVIAIIYLILLIGYGAFSAFTVVTLPNEYTVVKQFGKVVDIKANEEGNSGLSFKIPLIQSEETLPNTLIMYDLPVSNVITSDKKTMVSDCFALWSIKDPMEYVKQLNSSRTTAESRIDVNVYNSLKNTISQTTQEDVISGRNGALAESIKKNVGNSLEIYGLELISIETKHLDLPDSNKEAVYTRMISERNKIATTYKAEGEKEADKIRNETDKEVEIIIAEASAEAEKIIAEGEAEYMRILKEAYGSSQKAEFYAFVRALDAAKVSLKKGDVLYLDKNNPLAALFTNGY